MRESRSARRLYRSRSLDARDARRLAGSLLGTRVLVKANTRLLRRVFSVVIVVLGIEMLYKGLSGRI